MMINQLYFQKYFYLSQFWWSGRESRILVTWKVDWVMFLVLLSLVWIQIKLLATCHLSISISVNFSVSVFWRPVSSLEILLSGCRGELKAWTWKLGQCYILRYQSQSREKKQKPKPDHNLKLKWLWKLTQQGWGRQQWQAGRAGCSTSAPPPHHRSPSPLRAGSTSQSPSANKTRQIQKKRQLWKKTSTKLEDFFSKTPNLGAQKFGIWVPNILLLNSTRRRLWDMRTLKLFWIFV